MMTHGRALWACGALVLAAATFHCDVGIERGYATPDLSADSDYDLGPPAGVGVARAAWLAWCSW